MFLNIVLACAALGGQQGSPYLYAQGYSGISSFQLRYPVPAPLAKVMHGHVGRILERGWGRDLTPRDLDHGHFIWRNGWRCPQPCTPEKLARGVDAVLYHTAENADRWAGEAARGLPASRRTTRSVVGWPDGRVQPAIELFAGMETLLGNYESNGTVYDHELSKLRPDLFGTTADVPVIVEDAGMHLECSIRTQFVIQQDGLGRFRLPDKRPYDFHFACISVSGTIR